MDQGGGKRPGAFAVYIEPWHADVFEVLDMKKNHGKDELRARWVLGLLFIYLFIIIFVSSFLVSPSFAVTPQPSS